MAPSGNPNESNPQAGQGRPLPKKESDLFKNVVKHYETKQYKKAVKQADSILRKFPNHGETLAMKGLVFNCLSKKEEAHALVKEGLMNDMRSHVCWHVYGLLHRSDHNYNEAIKAYKQALRIESDNLQILRDLSMLQIQMRDLDGFQVTRHNILTHKPNGKINWLAFALAKHLMGDLRGAVKVIDIYISTLTEGAPETERGFEASELALYRNQILAEIPDNFQEALDHLTECEKVVVDQSSWLIAKCMYELNLKRYSDARQTALEIFRRGMTENFKIHSLYMCAILEFDSGIFNEAYKLPGTRSLASWMPLTDDQKQTLLEAYRTEIFPEFGSSQAVQRIPMNLVDGDKLRNSLDVFCRKNLVKGVPSLCTEISTFFLVEKNGRYVIASDPVDITQHSAYKLVVDLIEGYIDCLQKNSKLLPDDEVEEPPSTTLWTWYMRSGLHELAGEFSEGIALLDKCLEHTPTAVDVYELKGRLLKAAGDMKGAVDSLDKGRDLDRQDRYINNQTTRYMLQAGMESDALQRISLFTKHEGNAEANLYDMQCSWYELELAGCFMRKGKWGKSLKKYYAVIKHFDDFREDQFDFHGYCIRKVTLRAYTEVLRFEDNLQGEDYYFTAAEGTIQIYLHLFDNPSITQEDKEPDYSNMTAAQKKKAKNIARKKKIQAEKDAERRSKATESGGDANGNGSKKKQHEFIDNDPDGAELMKKDPLEEANTYSAILSKHAPKRFETWMLQFDVSIRRNKALLALQALFRMRALDEQRGDYFSRLVDFALKMPNFGDISDAAKTVVTEESEVLLGGKSVKEFVSEVADRIRGDGAAATDDLLMRVAVARSLVKVTPTSVAAASKLIVDHGMSGRGVTVAACRSAIDVLRGLGPDVSADTENWISQVKKRFPLMTLD